MPVGARTVTLAGPTDLVGFRLIARQLVAAGVAPSRVEWRVPEDGAIGLFDGAASETGITSRSEPLAHAEVAPAIDLQGLGGGVRVHGATVTARSAGTVPAAALTPDLFGSGESPELQSLEFRASDTVGAASAVDHGIAAAHTAADVAPCPRAHATQPEAEPLSVPRGYLALAERVALHSDPGRFALLYELLWRLQHEPALRGDPLDAQWMQADRMARAVRRDQHKMKAFVRFRPIARDDGGVLHVAWFEPDHHIVASVAPFFARRFAQMHWSILTPRHSVSWDGHRLQHGPGAARDAAPGPDAGEALWLTYYEHIFNPARLKLAMMHKEMPRRYWKNLPEATLIQPLTALAHERSGAMIERGASEPARVVRRLPAVEVSPTTSAPPLAIETLQQPAPQRAEALASVRGHARSCQRCPLWAPATQTVFGEGPVDCRLMLVGEQPGDQEDLRGRPFVGPAGQLFERALAELQVDRRTLYITNAVKHFKFELRGKRRIHKTPAQQEVAACVDWLEQEMALVQPQAVVALGATAARAVLGRTVGVLRERGRWLQRDDGVPVLVTLHPSALLRMPAEERHAAHAAWLADLRVALAGPPGR